MTDTIAAALGIAPMSDEQLKELREEMVEFKRMNKSQRWGGSMPGEGFGRPKGSKNVAPYPRSKKVMDRYKKHSTKMTERNAGRVWVTDGTHNKFVQSDCIPDGWRKGRVMKKRKKK